LALPPSADCSIRSPSSSKAMIPAFASTTSTGTCRTIPLVGETGSTGE
jgi:hypothetical protein